MIPSILMSFYLPSNFQIIAQLRKQVADLEAKTLADLPADAQETIQTYKDKLVPILLYIIAVALGSPKPSTFLLWCSFTCLQKSELIDF